MKGIGIKLTENVAYAQEFAAKATEQEASSVVDTVDFGVLQLEHSYHIVRPGGDSCDNEQANDAWYQTQGVQHFWDGQDTKPNHGLDHEHDCSESWNLEIYKQ